MWNEIYLKHVLLFVLSIMEGGAESGFHYVKPDEYKPRLLHFSGLKKHIVVKEVHF